MRYAAMTLLAAALGVACAMLVACGSDDKALIPRQDASVLKGEADRVDQAVANQDCETATRVVAAAIARIGKLPASVDSDLRQNLEDGFTNLLRQAETKCQAATTETTDTTTTETTPTETTDTTTTETTDTDTTDTETTDTETTDTETTDTSTTDDNGGGTGGNDSGGSGDGGTGDQGSGGTPAPPGAG
jgi:septal ring-binding cell division protein DamX